MWVRLRCGLGVIRRRCRWRLLVRVLWSRLGRLVMARRWVIVLLWLIRGVRIVILRVMCRGRLVSLRVGLRVVLILNDLLTCRSNCSTDWCCAVGMWYVVSPELRAGGGVRALTDSEIIGSDVSCDVASLSVVALAEGYAACSL